MARTPAEQTAFSRAKALVDTEVSEAQGGAVIRVAVRHTDPDHYGAATAHYGPAFDAAMTGVLAHVYDCSPGEVDLVVEARKALERARQEYPESDGWECWLEGIVPHESENRHIVRRIEQDKED